MPHRTITEWDDIRYFLAVARDGSVRAAAAKLEVNHATVLRRIARLEAGLGARLFDKLPSGYRLTAAGEEVLGLAEKMETSSGELETRVFGRDQSVRGLLRVTMPPTLVNHLLMPDLVDFARLHSEIELDVQATGELANLTKREADVALRVVYDRKTLPLNLHGVKGPDVFGAVYIARERLEQWREDGSGALRWIVIGIHGIPDWASAGELRVEGVPVRVADVSPQLLAVRQGLGLTTLPCFVGDADPLLARVPGTVLHQYGSLWLLTQGETRRTKRVRLFVDFMVDRLATHQALFTGFSEGPQMSRRQAT